MVNGLPQGANSKHCNKHFTYSKGGSITHLKIHVGKCMQREKNLKNQNRINFIAVSRFDAIGDQLISTSHYGNFDVGKIRKCVAHWILMHEHPFSILEEEGFNLMMKEAHLNGDIPSKLKDRLYATL